MTKDKKQNEISTYLDQNPNLDEVWLHVMESARSFEDELGFSRREICEGFIFGTMDLIKRREDSPEMSSLEEVHDFLDWIIRWVEVRKSQLPSSAAEKRYLKDYGLSHSDARDFGWRESPKETSH